MSSTPLANRSGATTQAAKATAEKAMVTISKRPNDRGSRPGFTRTIQLWVKLGMIRPPIRQISKSTADNASRMP